VLIPGIGPGPGLKRENNKSIIGIKKDGVNKTGISQLPFLELYRINFTKPLPLHQANNEEMSESRIFHNLKIPLKIYTIIQTGEVPNERVRNKYRRRKTHASFQMVPGILYS